jgi:hypothetical protein
MPTDFPNPLTALPKKGDVIFLMKKLPSVKIKFFQSEVVDTNHGCVKIQYCPTVERTKRDWFPLSSLTAKIPTEGKGE